MTTTDSRIDTLRTAIEDRLNWFEEYETTHIDAGQNYLDCCLGDTYLPDSALFGIFSEAGACQQDHANARTRAHGLPLARKLWNLLTPREVSLLAEARPGHILDSGTFPDGVSFASWAVGEIECDLSDVIESDSDLPLVEKLGETEYCLHIHGNTVLGYVNTDNLWYAVLTTSSCRQLIADATCRFCRLQLS